MTIKGKLQIKDHLMQIELINDMDYVFCNMPLESFYTFSSLAWSLEESEGKSLGEVS